MIGLIMAGGKGTRMNSDEEKLLLNFKKPIILHVIDALKNSDCFEKIIIATSKNSPKTQKIIAENNLLTIQTLGKGFVMDLNTILKQLDDFVFVTSGDLPLLDGEMVKKIIDNVNHEKIWTSIVSQKSFQESLNINPEYFVSFNHNEYVYTGISIINASKINNLDNVEENYLIIDDKRVCLNINTKKDFELLDSL